MDAGSRVKYKVYTNNLARTRHGGNTRRGTVLASHRLGEMVDVNLDGDPFGTYVSYERLELIPRERDDDNPLINPQHRKPLTSGRSEVMPTATKPSARELRRQAKALGVEGWEDMELEELEDAIAEADEAEDEPAPRRKKATAKKTTGKTPVSSKTPRQKAAAAKKAPKEDREIAENGNPYREGTNEWHATELLLRGGKRPALVKALMKKITLTDRGGNEKGEEAYDYQLLTTGQRLQKDHNFEYIREGRGYENGTAKVVAP